MDSVYLLSAYACRCGCGRNAIQPTFVEHVNTLVGKLMTRPIITSAYRCPKHNEDVSHTGATGPHTTGFAIDFGVDRRDAFELLTAALSMGVFTGIGINQKGDHRFIHLDTLPYAPGRPRPTIWSY